MSQELGEPGDRFRLRTHLKAHRASLTAGFVLGAFLLVLSVVQPFWAGGLVARVQDSQPITWTLVVVVGLSVGSAAVSGLQQYVLGQLAENSVARWRYLFVESFLHLPLLGRQSRSGGWFGARLVTDPPLIGRFIGGVIVQSVTSVLLAATSLIVLLTLDPVTVIVPIVFAVLSLLVSLLGARSAGSKRLVIQQENAHMSEVMIRAVDSARLVIASNADSSIETEIRASVESARTQGIRLNLVHSLVGPATLTFMQVAYASVFVVGGWRVASHLMSFPTFITFLLMFGLFQSAIQQVSAVPLGFSESRAALSHLSEIGEPAEPGTLIGVTATSHGDRSGAVRFDSVRFGYEVESAEGLRDVSFTLPDRKMSALIGSSGGGKSTCLGLMEGFFFADSGSVEILGREMSASSAVSLRESLGYVDQESSLVGNSVRSILLFGLASVRSDGDLRTVLTEVGLWDWVASRGGLDSTLDDRAIQISGGQRQLLAIARALLRQPQLLLLDEPTSNLDGAAEARVRRVLRSIAARTTVVISAHRLSTILEADWIVVLKAGRVVGEGSHEGLMSTSDYYRELVVSQSVAESRSRTPIEILGDDRSSDLVELPNNPGVLSGKSRHQ